MGRFYIILAFFLILLAGCSTGSNQSATPAADLPSNLAKMEQTAPATKPEATGQTEASPAPTQAPSIPSDQETKKPTEPASKTVEQSPNPVEQPSTPVEQPTKQPAEQPAEQPSKQPSKQPEATKPNLSQPAPTPATQPAQPEAQSQTVTVSITADQQQTILGETKVNLEDGENVLDVLKRITREKRIQMEYTGSGSFAYVQGINNLYEFDKGAKSGWMYRVNGVFGGKSAGALDIHPGDRIEWLYTLDLGKDLERGSSQ